MFRRYCKRECGKEQMLSESDINQRRVMYDVMMKKRGIKEYDNPYWWFGSCVPRRAE